MGDNRDAFPNDPNKNDIGSNLNLVRNYDTSGNAYDVTISGNYAYVADEGGGLKIIAVSYTHLTLTTTPYV